MTDVAVRLLFFMSHELTSFHFFWIHVSECRVNYTLVDFSILMREYLAICVCSIDYSHDITSLQVFDNEIILVSI